MNSNFPGEIGLDSSGEFWTAGKWFLWIFEVCRRGTIFRPRLPGMLVKNICILLLGKYWDLLGIPHFLRADSSLTLLGESVADLLEILCPWWKANSAWGEYRWILSYSAGIEGILVTFFRRTYLGTLMDRATRSLTQFIIAPVSDVTCN